MSIVRLNNKYGFVNNKGREVVPLIYESVEDFNFGLSKVLLNAEWGYIDKQGDWIKDI